MQSFLILINGWRNKTIRGGDYHILKMLDYWNLEHKISLIMPRIGYLSARHLLSFKHSIFFSSQSENNEIEDFLIISYFVRILKSIFFRSIEDIDVIISSSHMLYDILPALLLKRKFKSKLVVYVHHLLFSFRDYKQGIRSTVSLLCERISLSLCKKADVIFVVNENVKDKLIEKGFSSFQIFLTSNSIDQCLIDSLKVHVKTYEGCFCGTLNKRKGVYDLLEVWEKVLQYFPKSKLVIIGYGQEYNNLKKKLKEKGLEKSIILAGYVSDWQKIYLIKSSKIFIFPSYEEGWGIVISEAISCGLPIVCYDLPTLKFYGSAIHSIEIGNKESMAKTIMDILDSTNHHFTNFNNNFKALELQNWRNIAIEESKILSNL